MKEMLYAVRCLKSSEDMILTLAGQFKQFISFIKQCMVFFLKLKLNYLSKMHGYPQFPSWIPRVLTKIYFLRIVLNRAKISLY